MEIIFSLSYSEYSVVQTLSRSFKKKEGYSFYVPTSRQEPDVDFLLRNAKTGKVASFQVKNSKPYERGSSKGHLFWYTNFLEKFRKSTPVDFYVLHGIYPQYELEKSRGSGWFTFSLVLTREEMGKTLEGCVLQKDKSRPDKMLYIVSEDMKVFSGARGFTGKPDLSHYLVEKRIDAIRKVLK